MKNKRNWQCSKLVDNVNISSFQFFILGKNTTKKSMAEVNNPAINVIIMTILMNEDQKWLWFENGSYMIESSLVII
jgi:hypothetical protein